MAQQSQDSISRYVIIHIATTCDEHGVYVTKDSAEVIEIAWILVNAKTLEQIHEESVLVKPLNTPITPLCTSLTTLTWEHVQSAGTFRDAINRFENFAKRFTLDKDDADWAFVMLDTWDLRVQLPREARDKSVVLPPYLQHSKSFDLRTEYQKWQQFHPESLPYASNSLSNICAALEVEPVQSSAPIKHNLPFHLQALATNSPRRAMEEAVTLTRIVRALDRRSQPRLEHQNVMQTPMDSGSDIRAFQTERSKVLYLSGLPHDTTQSELESWFTQFGGAPTAFWTLRTAEQHKPTGTGFAVFSSHEEASDSLAMNGRALNEKAIEVQPSSQRVLDRAQEVLMPFPPSKNRPRPGDWTCPSCGFSNFQRRTACFRCSYPAAGEQIPNMYGGYPYGMGQMIGPTGMPSLNPGMHAIGGMPVASRRGGDSRIPFRAGDWRCGAEGCNYHNFAKNINCLRCGASRTSVAMSAAEGSGAPGMDGMTLPGGFGMQGPMAMASGPIPGAYGGMNATFRPAGVFNSPQPFGAMPPPQSFVMNPMGPSYGPPSHLAFGSMPAAMNRFVEPYSKPPTQHGSAPESINGGSMSNSGSLSNMQYYTTAPPAMSQIGTNINTQNADHRQSSAGSDPFTFLNHSIQALSLDADQSEHGKAGNTLRDQQTQTQTQQKQSKEVSHQLPNNQPPKTQQKPMSPSRGDSKSNVNAIGSTAGISVSAGGN